MAAPKGFRPPNAGKGRPKGSRNHITVDLKDMVLGALKAVGGQKYLERQAEEKPEVFVPLVGKCLPKDVNVNGGLKLQINLVGKDSGRTDG